MLSLISANFTENYENIFSWDGKNMEWLEEKKRQAQINNGTKSDDEAYFGYERINTVDKTDRVLQHFNSVARHYDFMNTLLSFGIHYAWKRTAVRMLKLTPGDRVLDVCGGTGDLAILAARAIGPAG
jgi:demethylmenaquinone methyltransferase/2-methoxy-6-polyprenyl-1,4-benzoquinol methylase